MIVLRSSIQFSILILFKERNFFIFSKGKQVKWQKYAKKNEPALIHRSSWMQQCSPMDARSGFVRSHHHTIVWGCSVGVRQLSVHCRSNAFLANMPDRRVKSRSLHQINPKSTCSSKSKSPVQWMRPHRHYSEINKKFQAPKAGCRLNNKERKNSPNFQLKVRT